MLVWGTKSDIIKTDMKKVANIKNEELRKEQLNTLVEVLEFFRSKDDLELFIACFLTDSEKAFLGQRLNIMRMLAKNFSYKQIEEKLHASTVTIASAHKCLEKGGELLKLAILHYKFKPDKTTKVDTNTRRSNQSFIKPHMPGSIF